MGLLAVYLVLVGVTALDVGQEAVVVWLQDQLLLLLGQVVAQVRVGVLSLEDGLGIINRVVWVLISGWPTIVSLSFPGRALVSLRSLLQLRVALGLVK